MDNPIKYYEDGRAYLIINNEEISDHPAVDCLVRLEAIENKVLPAIQARLDLYEDTGLSPMEIKGIIKFLMDIGKENIRRI